MLSWLNSIWNDVTGAINDVRNWILSIIAAVYSFISREFAWVTNFASWVYRQSVWLYNQAINFGQQVYSFARWIVTDVIPSVERWVTGLAGDIWGYLTKFASWVSSTLDWLRRYAESLVKSAIDWVIHNVWNPLWTDVMTALGWIGKEGAFVFYLLTHPDQLAKLLGKYMWGSWLGLLKTYGRPIGRFMARQSLGYAHDIASVIEEIISAIL